MAEGNWLHFHRAPRTNICIISKCDDVQPQGQRTLLSCHSSALPGAPYESVFLMNCVITL